MTSSRCTQGVGNSSGGDVKALTAWVWRKVIAVDDFDLSHTGDDDGWRALHVGHVSKGMQSLRDGLMIEDEVDDDLLK